MTLQLSAAVSSTHEESDRDVLAIILSVQENKHSYFMLNFMPLQEISRKALALHFPFAVAIACQFKQHRLVSDSDSAKSSRNLCTEGAMAPLQTLLLS